MRFKKALQLTCDREDEDDEAAILKKTAFREAGANLKNLLSDLDVMRTALDLDAPFPADIDVIESVFSNESPPTRHYRYLW